MTFDEVSTTVGDLPKSEMKKAGFWKNDRGKPQGKAWLDAGYARHLWQCDACGYTFETTVRFAAA